MIVGLPALAIVGFIIVMIIRTVLGARHKELELKARIVSLENNIPLEPARASQASPPGNLMVSWGIILIFSGLGLSLSFGWAIWVIMPISTGLGLIVASRLSPKPPTDDTKKSTDWTTTPTLEDTRGRPKQSRTE